MGETTSKPSIQFNYECQHMEQFEFHENIQRSDGNKKITLSEGEATCYGSQRLDSSATALWIFEPNSLYFEIGLIEANKQHCANWAKNHKIYREKRRQLMFTDQYDLSNTDAQYYGIGMGCKFKTGAEPQGFNLWLEKGGLIFMELSNGLLKCGGIPLKQKNSIEYLSTFSLQEVFQIDSNKRYKMFVRLTQIRSSTTIFHSRFESFNDWHQRELSRFQQQHSSALEMHDLQQKAKKEEKLAKIVKVSAINSKQVEISMEQQTIQKLEKKQKMQQKHNWTTLLTVLIALFSAIGSVALTDSMGLDDQSNGAIAISMSILSLATGICKFYLSWTASNSYSDQNESFIHSDVDSKFKVLWMSYSLKMKTIAVFVATVTDLVFDFFQGIAAVQAQKYTDNAWIILVISTWIGVADEVIECFVEIFFMSLQQVQGCEIAFCFGFLLWSIAESIMGCYLLSTYNDDILRLAGVSVEVNLIIFSLLFVILFAYWIKKKK
eukprot:129647_1